MRRSREWFFLLLVVAVALTIRIAYLAEISSEPEFNAPAVDAGYHDYWARALANRPRLRYGPVVPK